MTDTQTLLHDLADKLDHYRQALMDDRRCTDPLADRAREVAAQQPTADALQAAADAELEACCHYLVRYIQDGRDIDELVQSLRNARRPPALSVREQAITALRERLNGSHCVNAPNFDAMQLALRALEGGDG